jgi:hypothetical protein
MVLEQHQQTLNQTEKERHRVRQVVLTALSILERPPIADHFFDGFGTLARYKQKTVTAYNIVDCGERTQLTFQPSLISSILH